MAATCPSGSAVHIEDRGYQFADGVYEVCEVARGYIVDMTRHLDRLGRSLTELGMAWPIARKALEMVLREVVRRNRRYQRTCLSSGDPRRRSPRSRFSGSRNQSCPCRNGQTYRSCRGDKKSRSGPEGHHRSREPMGQGGHQDDRAVAQRAGAPEGQGGRRSGSVVRGSPTGQ